MTCILKTNVSIKLYSWAYTLFFLNATSAGGMGKFKVKFEMDSTKSYLRITMSNEIIPRHQMKLSISSNSEWFNGNLEMGWTFLSLQYLICFPSVINQTDVGKMGEAWSGVINFLILTWYPATMFYFLQILLTGSLWEQCSIVCVNLFGQVHLEEERKEKLRVFLLLFYLFHKLINLLIKCIWLTIWIDFLKPCLLFVIPLAFPPLIHSFLSILFPKYQLVGLTCSSYYLC